MHELSFAPYIGSLLTHLHAFNATIPHNQLSPTFAFDSEKSIWRRQGAAKSENEPEEISVGQGLMFRCSAVKSTDKVIQVCVCVCVCVCAHNNHIHTCMCTHTNRCVGILSARTRVHSQGMRYLNVLKRVYVNGI